MSKQDYIRIQLDISPEMKEDLRVQAFKEKRYQTEIIRSAINQYLNNPKD